MFTVTLSLLSVQNANRMASRLTTIASFPSVFFQFLQYSRQHPSFSAHWAALMTTTYLNYPAISLGFVDFAVQFWFHCKFSFHEATLKSSLTVAWFSWTNHNPLLRIATNGIASFCIDHRWRQMAFFVFVRMGKAPLSRALREIKQLLCVQSLILYYIKQIDSMLPYICPVIDHRGRQNVVRTSVTHSAIASCTTFLFLPHFDVICDLLLDRCTATWNLFVK